MYTINQYVKVESLDEAYELNQKKMNTILGGTLWLRMGNRNVNTAIDLEKLGLHKIEETEQAFVIGCMTSLRDMEMSEALHTFTQGAIRESLRHIVGVQFRNCATIGGSIYGRFGFSDILTCLLVLDTEVELYKRGIIPLAEFVKLPPDNDILVHIIIKKTPRIAAYVSLRNSETDFPVIACAVSKGSDGVRSAIGARPGKAALLGDEAQLLSKEISTETIEAYAAYVQEHTVFGTNMRASGEYRKAMAGVLIKRALRDVMMKEAE